MAASRPTLMPAMMPGAGSMLVSGSGAGVASVAVAVADLVREGWLVDEAGWLEVAVSGLPP